MPQLYVIFDTNVYRRPLLDIDDLCRREVAAGVEALASLWPCLELLNHCAAGDPHQPDALGALPKVWRHTGYEGHDGPRLRVHADGETTLALGLFGKRIEARFDEHGFVANMIRAAVCEMPDEFVRLHPAELAAVSARVAAEETRFADSLRAIPKLLAVAPRAGWLDAIRSRDGLRSIVRTRIETLASDVGGKVDQRDLEANVDRVLAAYPIAMYFLRDLVEDVLNAKDMNFDKPRNRNSTWDLKLAFHASVGARVAGVPVLLVSADGRIHRAAAAAGLPHQVARWEEYSALLTDSGIAERARLLLS